MHLSITKKLKQTKTVEQWSTHSKKFVVSSCNSSAAHLTSHQVIGAQHKVQNTSGINSQFSQQLFHFDILKRTDQKD